MPQRRDRLVVAIGSLKLLKALSLFAIGITSLIAFPRQIAHALLRGTHAVGLFSSNAAVHREIAKLASMDGTTSKELGALALAYGGVFLIEGVGLVMKKRWAEWLTVVVTASFIPFELYEIVVHPGIGKVIALILNVAIVVYLAWRRLHDRKRGRGRRRALTRTASAH